MIVKVTPGKLWVVTQMTGCGALVRPRFETGGQHEVVGYLAAIRTTGAKSAPTKAHVLNGAAPGRYADWRTS